MIKVVIYDDNSNRRESLGMLLRLSQDLELSGLFEHCGHVLEDMKACKPDLVLMDLEMPVKDGFHGIREIKKNYPNTRVIVQTVYDDEDKIFEALRSGADGYILKSASIEKIFQSIDDVMQGGASMSPSIAHRVLQFFGQPPKEEKPIVNNYNLSTRELEVLKKLSAGKSYKLIADELGVSYFTVNSHVRKIYDKLQVHSVGEAIGIAFKEGLV